MAHVDSKKQEVKYDQLELELHLPELPPPLNVPVVESKGIVVFDTVECEWIQL
jgi:hypothetical protein